jgi:hypothetical protein
MTTVHDGPLHTGQETPRDLEHLLGGVDRLEEHDELVTAVAGNDV